jgi:hypothetical protein
MIIRLGEIYLIRDFDHLQGIADIVHIKELLRDPIKGHRDETVIVGNKHGSVRLARRFHSRHRIVHDVRLEVHADSSLRDRRDREHGVRQGMMGHIGEDAPDEFVRGKQQVIDALHTASAIDQFLTNGAGTSVADAKTAHVLAEEA